MGRPRKSAIQPAKVEQFTAWAAMPTSGFAVSRSINDMSGEALKAHARKIGIQERDVNGLSEDRLRQNCMAMVSESFEDD
jgi:hypothetical protein